MLPRPADPLDDFATDEISTKMDFGDSTEVNISYKKLAQFLNREEMQDSREPTQFLLLIIHQPIATITPGLCCEYPGGTTRLELSPLEGFQSQGDGNLERDSTIYLIQ